MYNKNPTLPTPPISFFSLQLSTRQSRLRNPLPAHTLHLRDQISAFVQRLDIVAAADAFTVDEDVGDSAAPCALLELVLQARTEGVFVELDHEGRWGDGVFGEEDEFGLFGMRAVGFGEDDDCGMGETGLEFWISDDEQERHTEWEEGGGVHLLGPFFNMLFSSTSTSCSSSVSTTSVFPSFAPPA